jgi:hypothetical protein
MSEKLIKHKEGKPRRAGRTADDTMTVLWDYYYSNLNIELSPKEEELRQRFWAAWEKLIAPCTTSQTVNWLCKEYDVAPRTAYNYITGAKMLFGEPGESDRQAKKQISESLAIKGMEKALEAEDFKAYATLLKRYNEVNDLEGADNAMIANILRGLKAYDIFFKSDEEVLDKQIEDMRKDIPAVDIDFEDMSDEEGEG